MSENCLNMNIYTPSKVAGLRPVLFFVYGGGNLGGTNTDYSVQTFARLMEDFVVVVPNYRLGTLGYLVHEPSGLYGNYGIGDILTALRFVRPLLESFGGDVSRITLMGQSSGATNIFALLASPQSEGLFRAAICLSGSPNITMSVTQASTLHQKYILRNVGCDVPEPQVRSCLMQVSPEDLTNGVNGITGPPPSINPPGLPFSPSGNELIGLSIVDGVIVKKPLLEAVSVPIIDVPLIIQSCQAEMDPTVADVDHLPDVEQYHKWLTNYLSSKGWTPSTAAKVVELYKNELNASVELGFESFLTDVGVTCGNDQITEIASQSFRSPVFRTHLMAAPTHAFYDKRYAFHTWDMPITGAEAWSGWDPLPEDKDLGTGLRLMWRNFLLTGTLPNETGWNDGGCTGIGRWCKPQGCAVSKCKALEELGFSMNFWWAN